MLSLFNLGLIVLAVILVIMSISMKEGFDFSGREAAQNTYLKTQDTYWNSRLFPQVVKGVDNESKFLALNKDKTKLNKISPTGNIDKGDVAKKIEKCRIINRTGECNEIEKNSCGYCWDTDKIIYGDALGPATDVCSKKNWIPPGPRTGFYCQKKKEQELCKTMKDCGDSTGEKSICAWCPLKAKGVPKKRGPEGGWVAKYDEDKCDWKSQLMDKYGKCKDIPTKNPSKLPNKAWHDRDGPSYSCKIYGANNKAGCKAWGTGYIYQEMTGNKACCACGGGTNSIDFLDNLIDPKDCKRFNQLFPCVGPNMLTGPHSSACLQSLWDKAGCSGDLKNRVSDTTDYNNWNTHSYGATKDNMEKSIKEVALSSANYLKAQTAHKKCFGKEVDSCESRFKPRPQQCAQKIYNKSGCSVKGKLNPTFTEEWPTSYVSSGWKTGQEGGWSVNGYESNVRSSKTRAQSSANNPKANFDNTIKSNMLCYGEMPNIPWDKPCWRDFNIIMSSTDGIIPSNGNLSFNKGPTDFKSLLTVSSVGWWKNEYTWVGNYEVTKEKYEGKYFPFWNFISTGRNYWNKNWSTFKTKLLKVPGVGFGYPDKLSFLNGSPFDNAITVTSSKSEAQEKGYLYQQGNSKYLSKEAFMNENFPYWFFIRIARVH